MPINTNKNSIGIKLIIISTPTVTKLVPIINFDLLLYLWQNLLMILPPYTASSTSYSLYRVQVTKNLGFILSLVFRYED